MVRLLGMDIRPADGRATAGLDDQTLGHHRVGHDHARGGDDFRRGLAGVTGVEWRIGIILQHELRHLGDLFAAKLAQEPQPEVDPCGDVAAGKTVAVDHDGSSTGTALSALSTT